MNREGSALLFMIVIVGILILGGGFWYLKNDLAPASSSTALQIPIDDNVPAKDKAAASEDPLALVPISLNFPVGSTSASQKFSYYGVEFNVPWNDKPAIVSNKYNNVTQLKFSGGQFITILSSSSYENTAQTLLFALGADPTKIKDMYGEAVTSSDYNLLSAVINTTPASKGTGSVAFLSLKQYFFDFLGKDGQPLAIYNYSLPTAGGIELVGQNKSSGQTLRINFLFDAQGKGAHDFVIGGATEDDANSILGSIKMK